MGFHGDDLVPEEISAALGAEPTFGLRKGAFWRTATGEEKLARQGSWRIKAECCQPGNLDGQINSLLDKLSGDLYAWRTYSTLYRGRAFCGLFLEGWNEGLTLQPETLVRLGERGLCIDFEIYGRDELV
ncbi:MAG: hypothetical protein CFE37_05325 [Alphaproteobacteria bacterium PA4]|nr:MAG: hypothetical protein CFE37_05325 [Alphaproteobacteria bacterium PA4]